MNTKVYNRMTFAFPWMLGVAAFFLLINTVDVPAKTGLVSSLYSTGLTVATNLLAIYAIAVLAYKVSLINNLLPLHVPAVKSAITGFFATAPVIAMALMGYVAAIDAGNASTALRFITPLLIIAPGLFAAFAIWLVLSFVLDSLILNPVYFLAKIEREKPKQPAQVMTEVAQDASVQAQPQDYEFDWSTPTKKLDSMAGMAEFKAEVNAFIAPFRGYAKREGKVSDTNGILFTGPAGTGKTTMAELIAGELGLPLIRVGSQDITSKYVNESGKVIKSLFRQAASRPCVVFMDEVESIAQDRNNANMHSEDKKVVTALLDEIVRARSHFIVLVAASNYPEQIDAAIVRDGRFDLRIDVPYPDLIAREAILKACSQKHGIKADSEVIHKVAALWERRPPSFIDAVAKRMRNVPGLNARSATVADFKKAAREASRRASNIPRVGAKLSEIALPAVVRKEADSLVYRLKHWEEIAEQGGEPPSGVLLYGPPGTGKTNMLRAIGRELGDWHIFEVSTPEVLQDPKKFREVVELAATHRPAIVFMDEAEELLRDRATSRFANATNEILKSMDGLLGKVPEVVFMAATNNVEVMDAAALRGGRFSEKIYIGKLAGADLLDFITKAFQNMPKVSFAENLTPQALADVLEEAAPADILTTLKKAVNNTLGANSTGAKVGMEHIYEALNSTQI